MAAVGVCCDPVRWSGDYDCRMCLDNADSGTPAGEGMGIGSGGVGELELSQENLQFELSAQFPPAAHTFQSCASISWRQPATHQPRRDERCPSRVVASKLISVCCVLRHTYSTSLCSESAAVRFFRVTSLAPPLHPRRDAKPSPPTNAEPQLELASGCVSPTDSLEED